MVNSVTISGESDSGYASLQDVELRAVADPPHASLSDWVWRYRREGAANYDTHPADTGTNNLQFPMATDLVGSYQVSVVMNGEKVTSPAVNITIKTPAQAQADARDKAAQAEKNAKAKDNEEKDDQEKDPAGQQPVWFRGFAVVAAIVAVVALAAFLIASAVLSDGMGVQAAAVAKMTTRELLAARMFGVLLLLGSFVLIVGLWMVTVEWRGRFLIEKQDGKPKGLSLPGQEVLETLAKLKGAGLVLLTGLVIVLAAAWVGSAAVPQPNPSAPAATPTPTTTG